MNVLVIGAGIVGLSAAWALARSGHDVTVLEQGPIPNPASASFDQHRMIRPHYGDQAGYTQMVGDAHDAWDLLWEDLGISHYAETGVLAVNLGDHNWMNATRRALEVTGTPFDIVDRRDVERHAPALRVDRQAQALYAPRAGLLFAERIVADLSKWLERKGVALRPRTPVSRMDASGGRVMLENGDELEADSIVVAVGAWVGRLVDDIGARVKSIRSVVGYVQPPEALAAAWMRSPALFLMTPAAHLYCLPPARGTGLKFGGAPNLRPGDPDTLLSITDTDLYEIKQAIGPYLKDPEGHRIVRGSGAYYADPADKRFIVERSDRAIVVTGCGGRMFKFGALVGLRIAQCLEGELGPRSLAHWARGDMQA